LTGPTDPAGYPAALAAYYRLTHDRTAEILTTPLARSIALAANAALATATAERARLIHELDGYHGRDVYHCTAAQAEDAMATLTDPAPGAVLRATDTGQEWTATRGGSWLPR
jgi:hypothetical protein